MEEEVEGRILSLLASCAEVPLRPHLEQDRPVRKAQRTTWPSGAIWACHGQQEQLSRVEVRWTSERPVRQLWEEAAAFDVLRRTRRSHLV